MNFQFFSQDPNEHAPFSASSPSWINMTDDQIINAWKNKFRKNLGDDIHDWVSGEIECHNKPSSVREVARGIKRHIYNKYKKDPDKLDLMLRHLRYLPGEAYGTVKSFITDTVNNDMQSERKIGYSYFFNGRIDAVKFDNKVLQIYDLKTGSTPAKPEQLYVYCAEYCLQNNINPFEISFEIRIYQNDEIFGEKPASADILALMENIVHKNKLLMKFEGVTPYASK
jgi:hypothetical protein